MAAAHICVNLEAHVVRHIVLPHINQRIQSILRKALLVKLAAAQVNAIALSEA